MPHTKLPTWNVSDLYHGLTDPAIEADLHSLQTQAARFQSTYQPQLSSKPSTSVVKSALTEYTSLLEGIRKLEAYASLEFATNTTSVIHGAFLQKISTRLTDITSQLVFFEVMLSQLSTSTLNQLINAASLQEYRHWLAKQRDQKPHHLSIDNEAVLLKKSLTGKQAFIRFYEEQSTTQTYPLTIGSKKQKATMSQLLSLARSPRRQDRHAAARARHSIHDHDPLRTTFTYNTLLQDWDIDTTLRGFERPEDMRHLDNEITRPIVDCLVDTVVKNYPLVHDYYHFKRQLLGVPKLYDYDKYAPLPTSTRRYSFEEAKKIILQALADFSPQFAAIGANFFEKKWINAAPSSSKQAGAFCMYCTPATHPYIMVNFTGTADDVSTLAHELGHGIHAYLASEHNILNFDWPLAVAETASVFAEMLTFESLKANLKKPQDKLALYLSKIENIFATIPRQIAMFRFERQAHQLRRTSGELTQATLNALWIDEQQQMFGDSLTLTDYEHSYWQIIPHLFRSPFYVYSYAFGELVTLSLFRIYKEERQNFALKYTNLLRAGGSQSPAELMQPFGINLASPHFWQKGFDEIRQLITEAKELAKKTI